METIIDDERKYKAFLRKNRSGLVVNANRNPDSTYLVLHTVQCKWITRKGEPYTTAGFSKTCSNSFEELRDWAASLGGSLKDCEKCYPENARKKE
jgi:hypothetical protein